MHGRRVFESTCCEGEVLHWSLQVAPLSPRLCWWLLTKNANYFLGFLLAHISVVPAK